MGPLRIRLPIASKNQQNCVDGESEGFATQKNLVHLPENRFWNPKSESRIIENDARIQKWFNKTVYRFTEIVCNYLNEKDEEKDSRQII